VSRERSVDGVPTSLLDLGYRGLGIDDGWQLCGSGPADGPPPGKPVPIWAAKGFHNSSGYPNVNTTRFPSMRAMTAKARRLGLRPGWCADGLPPAFSVIRVREGSLHRRASCPALAYFPAAQAQIR
jgi:hypothetical protein